MLRDLLVDAESFEQIEIGIRSIDLWAKECVSDIHPISEAYDVTLRLRNAHRAGRPGLETIDVLGFNPIEPNADFCWPGL
jgi:hypothetical protein